MCSSTTIAFPDTLAIPKMRREVGGPDLCVALAGEDTTVGCVPCANIFTLHRSSFSSQLMGAFFISFSRSQLVRANSVPTVYGTVENLEIWVCSKCHVMPTFVLPM